MKVIIGAGGSGGHIFPSLALASELKKAGAWSVYFVASKRKLDRSLLENSGYKCFFLSINPMPRKFHPGKVITFLFKFLADIAGAFRILLTVRPDVVVGFGGYSSGAITWCAKVFFVPVLVHEQNFFPGRANRILSKMADSVAVSFEGTAKYLAVPPEKIFYSGNPLRADMLSCDRASSSEKLGLSPSKPTVLIMGGSQGASFLNKTASEAARLINRERNGEVQFVHLTGEKDYSEIEKFYRDNGIKSRVFSFLERMGDAYAVCDMAITRSGAAAIFELAHYAKPMILVPYPNPRNNQGSNAVYFSERGAAICREEKSLSSAGLAIDVNAILSDTAKRESMSRAAASLAVPEAAKMLAGEVVRLAQRRIKEKG